MNQTERKTELENIFSGVDSSVKTIITPLIDEVVFLEVKLEELRKLPTLHFNPKNPAQQKPTVSGKQYKEYLQQYSNCIKILCSTLSKAEVDEESPIQQGLKVLLEKYAK